MGLCVGTACARHSTCPMLSVTPSPKPAEPSLVQITPFLPHSLLRMQTPFYAPGMEEIIEKVKSGVWSFTPARSWAIITPEAKDFVTRMLQVSLLC